MKEAIHSPVVLDVAGLALEADDRRRLPLAAALQVLDQPRRDRDDEPDPQRVEQEREEHEAEGRGAAMHGR